MASRGRVKCYNRHLAMHILIIKLSSIGDVVHALPAAAMLRRGLPDASISWIVDTRASEILRDSPVIDNLIEIDTRTWRERPFARQTSSEVRARLKEIGRPDVAIDFQGLIKSGVITFASGAKRRIGFETADLRERLSRVFYTEQISTAHICKVIDKNLAMASAMAPDSSTEISYEFPISIGEGDQQYADDLTRGVSEGFALINPGGGWPTKLWAPERYGRLADRLWTEYGFRSFVTYGPGEEQLADLVVSSAESGMAKRVASTLKQFAALARHAELFIGGDTGPLHIAAACRTPIVGLYGPTSPERNGPFNPHDVTVGRDLWCRSDCHRRKCWHWECMEIPVNEVMTAVAMRLARIDKMDRARTDRRLAAT